MQTPSPESVLNVLGQPVDECSCKPLTGWFRDGFCRTDSADLGQHSVCCVMTAGFLAYSKAQYGTTIDWIGWHLCCSTLERSVVCTVRQKRRDELYSLSLEMVSANVVTLKALRSCVGKAQSMASLLFSWRPFLAMLWAALYSPPSSHASERTSCQSPSRPEDELTQSHAPL